MNNKILFIGSLSVNKQSQDFACQEERLFHTQLSWHWSMNMIKVLWWKFQQCLGTFAMVLVEESSEIGLFKHYLTRSSESVILEIQNLWGSYFFSKSSKLNLNFKNTAKNWEKSFCFSDNCIQIGIARFSLLRTGYFSLGANLLTSSPKILRFNQRDFLRLNWLGCDHWIR